jgi:glyoxylase-like metal-dependent hydrolase (beta-lactamase superfamily II)
MIDENRPRHLTPMVEAMFGLDGGAMFGIIPQPLWIRTNPPDEDNRIDLACRCLLVEYADRNVLIDVGIGTKWSDKERGIFNIGAQDPALEDALADGEMRPEDIDDVILTHLHFDHAGGVSRFADDGETIVASFPDATHWVQKRQWSWANSPSPRDEGSFRQRDFRFFEESDDAPPLKFIDGIEEILPGIEVLPLHGHTFGMQAVRIETQHNTFVYLADLIPTTSHMGDPYVMGYDLQPLETVKEKRDMLHHADRNDWILHFEHDPEQAFARVDWEDGDPVAAPVERDELPSVH